MSRIVKMYLPFFAGKVGTARLLFFGGVLLLVAALIAWAVSWVDGYEYGICIVMGLVAMVAGGSQISMLCEENSPHDFH